MGRTLWSAFRPAVMPGVVLLFAGLLPSAERIGLEGGREQDAKPPSPAEVLDRYIQVTGGEAAYRSLHNILSRGTFYISRSSARGTYTAYESAPNKTHTIFDFESGEKAEQGTLGDVVWERSSSEGARLLEGEEKTVALREATFNSMLNWRAIYSRVQYAGTENVGDRTCHKIVLTPASGKPLTQFFDAESGLLLKSFILLDSPVGEIRSENLYDNYRKDNVEVLFAHRLVHRIPRQEMVITLDSVRCNVDIPWYRFDLPAEVKALPRSGARKR